MATALVDPTLVFAKWDLKTEPTGEVGDWAWRSTLTRDGRMVSIDHGATPGEAEFKAKKYYREIQGRYDPLVAETGVTGERRW